MKCSSHHHWRRKEIALSSGSCLTPVFYQLTPIVLERRCYVTSGKGWKGRDGLSLVVFQIYLHVEVRTLFIAHVILPNKIMTEAGSAKKSVKLTNFDATNTNVFLSEKSGRMPNQLDA